jgi:hypothetical protein
MSGCHIQAQIDLTAEGQGTDQLHQQQNCAKADGQNQGSLHSQAPPDPPLYELPQGAAWKVHAPGSMAVISFGFEH